MNRPKTVAEQRPANSLKTGNGFPANQTVARAGVRLPDRPRYLGLYPQPTGGPVGHYGTNGPIGPWGSWK